VKLPLEKGVEEPKDTKYGWTPLWWAAERRHEAVVPTWSPRIGMARRRYRGL
jgi:hypothetical protein